MNLTRHETWQAICPAALAEDANHLMAAKLFSLADALTFAPNMQDTAGNQYCVCEIQLEPEVSARFFEPAERPTYDEAEVVDLAAAEGVRTLITVLETLPNQPQPGEPPGPILPPPVDAIVVFKGTGLVEAYALERITGQGGEGQL